MLYPLLLKFSRNLILIKPFSFDLCWFICWGGLFNLMLASFLKFSTSFLIIKLLLLLWSFLLNFTLLHFSFKFIDEVRDILRILEKFVTVFALFASFWLGNCFDWDVINDWGAICLGFWVFVDMVDGFLR